MRIILALSLWLAMVTMSLAEAPKFGWAMLAAQHKSFPCRATRKIASLHDQPVLAYLDSTFGRKLSCVRSFIDRATELNKPHVVIVYLSNEVCRRKRNCKKGDFLRQLSVRRYNRKLQSHNPHVKAKVIKRAQRIRTELLSIASPLTEIRLVLGLESNYTLGSGIAIHGYAIEAGWPDDSLIMNNLPKIRAGARYVEHHGIKAISKGNGTSFDGECGDSICDCSNFSRRADREFVDWHLRNYSNRNYILAWCPKHQGLNTNSTLSAPPPRKRKLKVKLRNLKAFKQHTQRYETR